MSSAACPALHYFFTLSHKRHDLFQLFFKINCCFYYCCFLLLLFLLLLFFITLDAGLLARSQYSEGTATGHLDTGFSWFPCA
jgi:hypothetical protein